MICLMAMALLAGVPALHAQTEPPPSPTAVPPTVVAPTIVPPTASPPTVVPPTEPPTEVPTEEPTTPATEEPTSVPSTEEPTAPPTEPATGTPAEEPTKIPDSTPQPAPTSPPAPTNPPAPTSPPVPTNPPAPGNPPAPESPPVLEASPQEAGQLDVSCAPLDIAATPVADPGDWTLLACTLDLALNGLESVEIRGIPVAPGWEIILLEPGAPNTPGLLNASNNRVTLSTFDGQARPMFLIGAHRFCIGVPETTLALEIATLSENASLPITYTAETPLADPPGARPEVTLEEAVFSRGSGTLRIGWENPLPECSWQIVLSLEGAGEVTLSEIDAPSGTLSSVSGDGQLSFVIPPGATARSLDVTLAYEDDDPSSVLVEAVVFP